MRLRFFSTLLLSSLCASAQIWHEGYTNAPLNLRYYSHSPTRLAHNSLQHYAVAHLGYTHEHGDFHAIDASGNASQFVASIEGVRHIGVFDVQGHIRYTNRTDHRQRWNSTLWLSPRNPFVLSDSVESDVTTEAFDMRATATATLSPRWRMGAEIGVKTGNRSDQTDPRPRSVTALIPIVFGAEYQANAAWSIGLSTGYTHRSGVVEYYSVRSDRGHQYFLMKGMGDYIKRSVGDESGYKRDYAGHTYTASAQATWQPAQHRWANFSEISLTSTSEKATDGGTSYTFKGGDYSEFTLTFANRLRFAPTTHLRHHLAVQASYTRGQATWYDQRRTIDPTYGVILYNVLNKSTIQQSHYATASLRYEGELTHSLQKAWLWGAGLGFTHSQHKQMLGVSTPTQQWQHLDIDAHIGKRFALRRATLLAQCGGGYHAPLSHTYGYGSVWTGAESIETTYVRPQFDYSTAGYAHFSASADATFPLRKGLAVGVNLQIDSQIATESDRYKRQSLTTLQLGTYLTF